MQVFNRLTMLTVASAIALSLISGAAYAKKGKNNPCQGLPTHAELLAALAVSGATAPAGDPNDNGGFRLNMWGTVVNRDSIVCAVAFTGADRDEQWPGSRVISEAKAYTANAYSLPGLALSTANLYASGQPGGSLWGLQFSNPTAVGATKAASRDRPRILGRRMTRWWANG